MKRVPPTRVGFSVQRLNTDSPHQRGNVSATKVDAFMAQQIPHHPAARKRVIEVNLVDAAHQAEIGIAN